MAKSKIIKINENVAEGVTRVYRNIENTVVGGYRKIENAFVDCYLTRDGEAVAEAKERIRSNM